MPDVDDDDDTYRCLWVNWKQEIVKVDEIDWKQEMLNAKPDEGDILDIQDIHLTVPAGKLPIDMIREEVQEKWVDVAKAKVKELTGLYDLGCFKFRPRRQRKNIIHARLAVTWKTIEGDVGIQCRLTVRGFNDKFQDLDTYAAAASRSGQRLASVVAVDDPDPILFSLDVSQAFAKCMTFEELSVFSGQDIRNVEFDVPQADLERLRALLGFKDFDPVNETLAMLKPIYTLKDVPRAWREKLHQVLIQWMSCRQFCSSGWRSVS